MQHHRRLKREVRRRRRYSRNRIARLEICTSHKVRRVLTRGRPASGDSSGVSLMLADGGNTKDGCGESKGITMLKKPEKLLERREQRE